MLSVAQIIVPLPIWTNYTYLIPQDAVVELGQVVSIEVGKRALLGIVLDTQQLSQKPNFTLKHLKTIDISIKVSQNFLHFIQKMADYNVVPCGEIVKSFLNLCQERLSHKGIVHYIRTELIPLTRIPPKRQEILALFQQKSVWAVSDLPESLSRSALAGLCDAGYIEKKSYPEMPPIVAVNLQLPKSQLGTHQQQAYDVFSETYHPQKFEVFFIDGITGSGKTELYFEMMHKVLEDKPQGQILILVPEIALTEQVAQRFSRRFGVRPALWHSDLSDKQKRVIQAGLEQGTIQVVVGARSALLLPFAQLALVVVDEEHDSSYKQEEGIRYNARDMAVLRAKSESIPIILASATPSLETYVNSELGRYQKLVLRERFGGATLPDIALVDMKQHPPQRGQWISPVLLHEIQQTIAQKQQVLLFINRRGYAPLMLCRKCGYRIECDDCQVPVVYHKHKHILQCHQCNTQKPPPTICPSCGHQDTFVLCGPGVERLHEEIQYHFPHLRSEILSSDYFSHFEALNELLHKIHSNQIHILIGTQMIAKGHDFPHLTLVGVIDADIGLLGGDLRASEKCFQLLEQVSGRAGRHGDKKGKVLLQTYHPQHPVMQALFYGQRDAFLDYEASTRLELQHPPFGRMAAVIVSGLQETETKLYADMMIKHYHPVDEVQLFGPTPAPLFMLRGKYRYRFLLKSPKNFPLSAFMHEWIKILPKVKNISVVIDIDPLNFL